MNRIPMNTVVKNQPVFTDEEINLMLYLITHKDFEYTKIAVMLRRIMEKMQGKRNDIK